VRCVVLALAVLIGGCAKTTPQFRSSSEVTAAKPSHEEPTIPSEQELGVPYYPGASPVAGENTTDLVDAQFATRDSIDKVVSFYKGNIRNAVATGDKNESLIAFEKDGKRYSTSIHRSQREGVTLISVNQYK
jgi:hypothetical protein